MDRDFSPLKLKQTTCQKVNNSTFTAPLPTEINMKITQEAGSKILVYNKQGGRERVRDCHCFYCIIISSNTTAADVSPSVSPGR